MTKRFRGKIVVVTGASSGIGRAAAHEFARQGATLVLAARGQGSLEAAAAECRALGAEAVAIPTDVADERAVQTLVATTTARFGRIDVFVGNAALFVYGLFEQTPTKAFKRVVDTNLYGHLHAISALLPHWKQRGKGTYVLVGSIQSLLSAPYQSAYVTSKHAALGLVDVLGDEYAGTGIRFTALLPSTIDTPIYQNGANYTGKTSHPLPPTVSVQRAGRPSCRPHCTRSATGSSDASRRRSCRCSTCSPACSTRSPSPWSRPSRSAARASRATGTCTSPPTPTTRPTVAGWRSAAA